MQIQVLITPHVWLQAKPTVRNMLAKEFSMTRSAPHRCVTAGGITRIESDGYTVDDLKALNAESMQRWLGFTTIDPEADIHALFSLCVDRVSEALKALEPEEKPVDGTEAPKAPETPPQPEMKPYDLQQAIPRESPKPTKPKRAYNKRTV